MQKLLVLLWQKNCLEEKMTGKVWLVGAGPSDVGLLTVKGKDVLEKAEFH